MSSKVRCVGVALSERPDKENSEQTCYELIIYNKGVRYILTLEGQVTEFGLEVLPDWATELLGLLLLKKAKVDYDNYKDTKYGYECELMKHAMQIYTIQKAKSRKRQNPIQ